MLDDKKPWGGVVSFVFVVLATIGFIVLGYFHGNMHLLTTLKNARDSVS
jgi:ABC-type cobalt transport system substrate-binding protein